MPKTEPFGNSKPKCWDNSFLRLATTGQRNSPEELLQELYRSLFFKRFSEGAKEELHPKIHEDPKRAALEAYSGRIKSAGSNKGERYYACPYPSFTDKSWERSNAERPLTNLLFHGALAQASFRPGPGKSEKRKTSFKDEYLPLIINALIGNPKLDDQGVETQDFFSCTVKKTLGDLNEREVIDNIYSKIETNVANGIHSFDCSGKGDLLADVIKKDFQYLCEQEPHLPRYHWIQLLLGFLSVSSCSWLLSQMRLTVYLFNWIIDILDGEKPPSAECIEKKFTNRYLGLFKVSEEPKREIYDHVESYAKSRVGLLIIIEKLIKSNIIDPEEPISGNPNKLANFLSQCSSKRNTFSESVKREYGYSEANVFVRRMGESFGQWKKPRKTGVGKNIEEYLRVLYKPATSSGINESYLIVRERAKGMLSNETYGKILPGPITMQLFLFLASKTKSKINEKGRLTIEELTSKFRSYGIDYKQSGAFEILKNDLLTAGLMKGSPDASSMAQLEDPFGIPKS
ncbi:hypothetical protein OAH15_00355 [bacterium]|nr:hypothetical protein [bacterium]